MSGETKATVIACVFTLLMSVGGAYTVMRVHDAVSAVRIDKLEDIACKQGQMLSSVSLDLQSLRSATDNSKDTMKMLTISIDEFTKRLGDLTTVMARLDERLKTVEKK